MIKGSVSNRKKKCQWLQCLNHHNLLPEEMLLTYFEADSFQKKLLKGRFDVPLHRSTKLPGIFLRKVCGEIENGEKLKDE